MGLRSWMGLMCLSGNLPVHVHQDVVNICFAPSKGTSPLLIV